MSDSLSFKLIFKLAIALHKKNNGNERSTHLSDRDKVDREVDTFLLNRKKDRLKLSAGWRLAIFIVSIILFALVYTSQFTIERLSIFILVLLLHEVGHILAMLAFGYRDATILFIPWFGALATAKKENASLSQKVWVSLAGPVPGLILAIIISIALPDNNLTRDARVMLIAINLINLLPIYPLDGGQIINLLIFSRYPYLAVVFQSIGVLIMGAIGLTQPPLLLFALLIALGIPFNLKLSKLRRHLESKIQNVNTEDREALVRFIFDYLSTSRYRNLNPHQKASIVAALVDDRNNKARFSTRLGLAIVYFVSLIGGFIGGIYALIPNFSNISGTIHTFANPQLSQKYFAEEIISRSNERLKRNPQDASAYIERSQGNYILKKYSIALEDLNRAIELEPNNPNAYVWRGKIQEVLGDRAKAKSDLDKANQMRWHTQLQNSNNIIQKQPNNVSAYISRSQAKMMLGNKQGAKEDINLALKLQPNSAEALLARANISIEERNYQLALADTDLVLKIEPKNSQAYEIRASIYESIGDKQRAEESLKQADLLESDG